MSSPENIKNPKSKEEQAKLDAEAELKDAKKHHEEVYYKSTTGAELMEAEARLEKAEAMLKKAEARLEKAEAKPEAKPEAKLDKAGAKVKDNVQIENENRARYSNQYKKMSDKVAKLGTLESSKDSVKAYEKYYKAGTKLKDLEKKDPATYTQQEHKRFKR